MQPIAISLVLSLVLAACNTLATQPEPRVEFDFGLCSVNIGDQFEYRRASQNGERHYYRQKGKGSVGFIEISADVATNEFEEDGHEPSKSLSRNGLTLLVYGYQIGENPRQSVLLLVSSTLKATIYGMPVSYAEALMHNCG